MPAQENALKTYDNVIFSFNEAKNSYVFEIPDSADIEGIFNALGLETDNGYVRSVTSSDNIVKP